MVGALLQRPVLLVGSGSKLVRYYNMGPDYMFPGNSYSDSPNASLLFAEVAQANAMIAAAEHVLWTARRPVAEIAILYPRSSTLWDQWHLANHSHGGLCSCCCTSSMVEHYIDYSAETYAWYMALATESNIPVDFLDEDALEEPQTLAQYKLIVVTQPNVPTDGQINLARWVRAGGTIVTVSAAGIADEYDDPSDIFATLAGVRESVRDRIALLSETDVNVGQPGLLPEQNGTATLIDAPLRFTAKGVVGKLTPLAPPTENPKLSDLAKFDDGTSAITSNIVGKGRAIHFAWLPGLSYWFSQTCTPVPGSPPQCIPMGKSQRNESIRKIMAAIPSLVGVVPPVHASHVSVETPLMLSPTHDNAVVRRSPRTAPNVACLLHIELLMGCFDACVSPCAGHSTQLSGIIVLSKQQDCSQLPYTNYPIARTQRLPSIYPDHRYVGHARHRALPLLATGW
jgi:hypothetical protein